jgi:drug/metabolite transporter (DMT)-like permease
MAEAVYLLCALTSLACAGLLLRSYTRSRMKLILWTSLCFIGLAVSNILLVIDLAIVTSTDLRSLRNIAALGGVGVLLYGMVTSEK